MPLPEFLRHNEGYGPDEHLPAGCQINAPGPAVPPLLAARLSADVLAEEMLSPAVSARVRHLVPVSAMDVTAHCTVLNHLAGDRTP
jgi:hypothetical protein